jgi:hypothetical protein
VPFFNAKVTDPPPLLPSIRRIYKSKGDVTSQGNGETRRHDTKGNNSSISAYLPEGPLAYVPIALYKAFTSF